MKCHVFALFLYNLNAYPPERENLKIEILFMSPLHVLVNLINDPVTAMAI